MTDNWLENASYFAVMPPPQWPLSADPHYESWQAGQQARLHATAFAPAVRAAFASFGELGFAPAAPDAWKFGGWPTVLFLRPDATLLIALYDSKTFFVIIAPRDDDDDTLPASQRVRMLIGQHRDDKQMVFGSYPLLASDVAGATAVLEPYAVLLKTAASPILSQQPVDWPELRKAVERAARPLGYSAWYASVLRHAEQMWAAQRWGQVVRAYEALEQRRALSPEERERLEIAREHSAPLPPRIVRGDESEREWLHRVAALFNEVTAQLQARRQDSKSRDPAVVKAWEDALHEYSDVFELVNSNFYGEALKQAEAGDPAGLEPVIVYLEADPWWFHTGYFKEQMLRALRHHQFTEEQAARLRRVILHVVDVGDRREFRQYCKLARRVDAPDLRDGLLERLRSDDHGIARRALWALSYLPELNLSADDVKWARTILLRAGDYSESWRFWQGRRDKSWLGKLARKYGDAEWYDELHKLLDDPELAAAATTVLRHSGKLIRTGS